MSPPASETPPSEPSKTQFAAAVRVTGLRKRFGYRDALAGIDLEIPARGCFTLLGPNGAGKSTLLRIIGLSMRPTAGRVEVLGREASRDGAVRNGEALRSQIGLVFHESFLRGELTLEENLRYYAELHGLDRSDSQRRAGDLMDRLGLFKRARDPVRTFSTGMMKRASIIRSLLHRPRLWVLDEPFSGLDQEGAGLLEAIIGEEKTAGRAVVLVTHDAELGLRLGDDAAFIAAGSLRARGKAVVKEFMASAGGSGAS